MMVLTYNLQVSIGQITVHHSLCSAGVATLMPNLGVLYSKVSTAIFILETPEQKMRKRKENC